MSQESDARAARETAAAYHGTYSASPAPRRTRAEVLAVRDNLKGGGCCERYANRQACDCLANAAPDEPPTAETGWERAYRESQAMLAKVEDGRQKPRALLPFGVLDRRGRLVAAFADEHEAASWARLAPRRRVVVDLGGRLRLTEG